MTRKEALIDLLAKVKTEGKINRTSAFVAGFEPVFGYDAAINAASWAMNAYNNGSLDAAKALHEAVLPGWRWVGYEGECWRVWERRKPKEYFESWGKDPARSWLIAILKALISMENET